MLSASDLMIGLFCQNIQTTMFHKKSSLLMDKSLSISVFCLYLSMYSIATIGIDRYVRIKHYASFKALLDCKSCVNVHMYTGISCFLSSRNGSHKYFLGKKALVRQFTLQLMSQYLVL